MNAATWILGAVSVVALVGVAVLVVVLVGQRGRHRHDLERRVGAAEVERADLLEQMDEMRRQVAALATQTDFTGPDGETYLITTAGQTGADTREAATGVVFRATLGQPIVKAAAFGHGLRRALSAESRNRMRFVMRQHTRLSRKERRREQKIAWREYQERQRAQAVADSPDIVVESP